MLGKIFFQLDNVIVNMKRVSIFLFVTFLMGCSHWVPPQGMSLEQARIEEFNCKYMSKSMNHEHGLVNVIVTAGDYVSCMRSRGFISVSDSAQDQNIKNQNKANTQPVSTTPGIQSSMANANNVQKQVYGSIDINELLTKSEYFKRFYALEKGRMNGVKSAAYNLAMIEIKRIAVKFCKSRNYLFISVSGENKDNYDTGYICLPEKPVNINNQNTRDVGDATFYFASYVDREFEQGRL